MATQVLVIKTADAAGLVTDSTSKRISLRQVINKLQALRLGCGTGTIYANSSATDPAFAANTVTVTYASAANNDTLTIAGTVLTCVTGTPSGFTQFKKVTDATATAANLAAAINGNTTLNKFLVATSALGVVTMTCLYPGTIGNTLTTVGSNDTGFAWGATALAGGTGGMASTQITLSFT